MTLYISEQDVDELLTMKETIEQVRIGFELQAEGKVDALPRGRVRTGKGSLNILPVAVDSIGFSGLKAYYGNRIDASFLVILFSVEDTKPVCIVEASRMGQLRTGAASGVMTDLLSRKDAEVLACVGTGYQAETQIEAVTAVRDIDRVVVSGRSAEKAASFSQMISKKYGLNAEGVKSSGDFGHMDILVTATTSRDPVISDSSVPDDCHINAIGANRIESAELETPTFCSAKTVVVDSREQAIIESGDLVRALQSGNLEEEHVNECWQVLAGKLNHNPHSTTDRTIFKSLGIGLEDLITARYVYEKALKEGRGKEV